MILKGNIRANGQELASHLLNERYEVDPEQHRQFPLLGNEKVEVAEVRGFASNDLHGAFAEVEAIATGTKSTKPLYSLSINPSQSMSREEYGHAIDKIEAKLGLDDQARAVVFHVKNGREHCHVVWSRIDTEKMQARHMEFDHQKLREVARELVRDFGHEMPKHLAEDRSIDRFNDKAQRPTLAEQGQQSRSGIAPAERREAVTKAYEMADSAGAFRNALQESGYTLARGDKRGFVVVDMAGDVHSLTRQINGAKAKEIEAKLELKSVHDLPSVQEAKELIASMERQKAEIATQERPDSAERVELAQDALKALTVAQKAEMKAINGHHAERLAELRHIEAERIEEAKRQIKEAYRPEWADMFKRHRAELKAIDDQTKTAGRRLGALLSGRAGDAFDFENRGTLAGAFNFVVRGQVDKSKLEKAHKAEKRQIGDGQKLAEREEIREIKAELADRRRDAQQEQRETIASMKALQADELAEAVEQLEKARRLSERDGTDLSQGDKHAREQGERPSFGFARQGFTQEGMSFGRGDDMERDEDEPERQLKPPGQSFTPG
ncbi:relaxase/mobilization nuclease domain-containing protein [Phaeobacter sp. JH20_24]|uniref:relaxase/mobilization nuclease domain-containing protein n=1 Tax=unclassified Phaeobacter TaxID=2621772 RepID=UPI003A867D76